MIVVQVQVGSAVFVETVVVDVAVVAVVAAAAELDKALDAAAAEVRSCKDCVLVVLRVRLSRME